MQIMESLSPEYIGSFDSREDLEKEFRKNWKMNCHHPDLPHQHDDFCDSLALSLLFTTIKEWDACQIN
jgi:hypothetical protein